MNRIEVDLRTGESKVVQLTQQEIDEALTRSAAEQAMREVEEAKRKLETIDRASIRALREWVAKQPDAPQFLKDREAEAQAERERLK